MLFSIVLNFVLLGSVIWFFLKRKRAPFSSLEQYSIERIQKEITNLRDILDKTAIISITDVDGNILDVNKNFETISKYSKDELIGQNSRILNSGYHDLEFWKNFWAKIKNKELWRYDIKNRAKDGSFYWVDTSIIPELNKDGSIKQFHSIRYDITDKKNMEKELIDQNKLIQSIGEIQKGFLEGIDENEIFDKLLNEILLITGSEYGYIGEVLYKDEAPYLKTKSITDISWNEETSTFYKENAPIGLEFYNLESLFGYVLKHKEHVISNDPQNDERAAGIPVGHPDLNKYLGVALRDDNELVGSVGIANKSGGYSKKDIAFLAPYLDTCTLLITAIRDKREIITTKEQALAASEAKSNFLSSMSHEMRTPLNAILGITQIIKDEELEHKLKDDFEVIESSSQGLLNLVNDILDISKIEFGAVTVNKESLNLHQLIKDLYNMFKKQAENKFLKLELSKTENVPEFILGDKAKIKQVLINLIGNAIKFTSTGYVKLKINYKSEDAMLLFHVEDTGLGIETSEINNIFDMFCQADGSISKSHGGTGLGLSISKKLAELMQGDIIVVSEKMKGSTFTFRCICPISNQVSNSIDNDVVNFKKYGLKVLIVEDNELNFKILSRLLEKLGVVAEYSVNGQEALNMVKDEDYDLIFMDVMMPIMDGVESTQKIRKLEKQKRPQIIACSANALETEVQKCYDAGMDDFLPKPVMMKSLIRILNKAVRNS